MIFSAKNEDGVPSWKLVLTDQKTVTRRLKPEPIGAIRACQPGRCQRAKCQIKILSCMTQREWFKKLCDEDVHEMAQKLLKRKKQPGFIDFLSELFVNLWQKMDEDSKKEGFKSWLSLLIWFINNRIDYNETYRIEFERVK